MSEIFSNYPENLETVSEVAEDVKFKQDDIKKLIKKVAKICKEERKKRKILQKIYRQQKKCRMSEQDVDNGQEASTDKEDKSSKCEADDETKNKQKKEKSFLNRLGDAFLKALPSIFRTIASAAVTAVFGFVSKQLGARRRTSYAT